MIVLATLVCGEHDATLRDLQKDVEVGKVSLVQVTGDLPAGSTRTVWQDVR